MLYVEEEVHDVTILDYVFLAFDSEFSGGAACGFRFEGDEVFVFDDLGADEAFFEVGVDHSGGLRGLVALVDGPCAAFVSSGGEVGAEVEEGVGTLDESYYA